MFRRNTSTLRMEAADCFETLEVIYTAVHLQKTINPVTFTRVTQPIHTWCRATCSLQPEHRLGDLVCGTETGIANCPHLPLILPSGPKPCCQVEPRSRDGINIEQQASSSACCWEITWNEIGCPEDGGNSSIRNVVRVGLGLFTDQGVWNWDRRTSLPHGGTHQRRYNLNTWQRRQTDTTVLQVMAVSSLAQWSHCLQLHRQNNAKSNTTYSFMYRHRPHVSHFID